MYDEFIDMPTLEQAAEEAYEEMRRITLYVEQILVKALHHYTFHEQIVIAEMIADTAEVKEIAEYYLDLKYAVEDDSLPEDNTVIF